MTDIKRKSPIQWQLEDIEVPVRACATCRHKPIALTALDAKCRATGNWISWERSTIDRGQVCGPAGDLWEKLPPRRGILTVLRDWLVGGW